MNFTPVSIRKIVVVMAGGSGTRFWPWSRTDKPKQFLNLTNNKQCLLQQTVSRLLNYFRVDDIFILTTEKLVGYTQELLPNIKYENILIEPESMNTAPCLILALVMIEKLINNGLMLVVSADSWIGDDTEFFKDINVAFDVATRSNDLVVFGIRPTYPEIGYGYIEARGCGDILNVASFQEKPTYQKALEYMQSGNYYWNAGMFVWTIKSFRVQLEQYCSKILKPLDDWILGGSRYSELVNLYPQLPKISIDYALMEQVKSLTLIPAHFRWSDVGSWTALSDFYKHDVDDNIKVGDVVLINSRQCMVFGSDKVIACLGISNLVIVDESDVLLVCNKDNVQDIRLVVEQLKNMDKKTLI